MNAGPQQTTDGDAAAFEGDEPTEVMSEKKPEKAAASVPPPAVDESVPDREYVAPRVIPVAATPGAKQEEAKIVINVPTPAPPVAEVEVARARRRAPTVKIQRGTLAAQGLVTPGGELIEDAAPTVPTGPRELPTQPDLTHLAAAAPPPAFASPLPEPISVAPPPKPSRTPLVVAVLAVAGIGGGAYAMLGGAAPEASRPVPAKVSPVTQSPVGGTAAPTPPLPAEPAAAAPSETAVAIGEPEPTAPPPVEPTPVAVVAPTPPQPVAAPAPRPVAAPPTTSRPATTTAPRPTVKPAVAKPKSDVPTEI